MNISSPSNEVHGLLKGVSLTNFLQLIEVGGDSCLLEVRCGESDEMGRIYINEGVLFDAHCGTLSGTAAASRMLKWDKVEILLQELPDVNMHKQIDRNLTSIILMVQGEDEFTDGSENGAQSYIDKEADDLKIINPDEHNQRSEIKDELKKVLEKMTGEMDGLIASAIVSIDDGLQIEQVSNQTEINSESASAYLAHVVKSNQEALRLLGWDQSPEDILITTEDCYFIIRQLPGDSFFLFVLTTRDEWIGRTRLLMAEYSEKIAEYLDLMQK